MRKFDLDEQIECAIRERGAKVHLQQLEHKLAVRRRIWVKAMSIAASFIIFLALGINIKLSLSVKDAGYAFNPVAGQSGGSEITALMDDKKIREALEMIKKARVTVTEEMQNPSYNDTEYSTQLEMDSQELDLLEAVCYMRQGKYFKAKKHLRDIVKANGHYASEAIELLEVL